jgi:hypothetical protein
MIERTDRIRNQLSELKKAAEDEAADIDYLRKSIVKAIDSIAEELS